jgi:hypothetical protein
MADLCVLAAEGGIRHGEEHRQQLQTLRVQTSSRRLRQEIYGLIEHTFPYLLL